MRSWNWLTLHIRFIHFCLDKETPRQEEEGAVQQEDEQETAAQEEEEEEEEEEGHEAEEQEEDEDLDEIDLPDGVIFDPTDQDLASQYLINMNLGNPLPVYPVIPAIHAAQFYSMPPIDLVANQAPAGERQWFFFVNGGVTTQTRAVGNGGAAGSWRSFGDDFLICDSSNGEEAMGLKILFTYYSGIPQGRPRRTSWKMDEYTLPHNNGQWVLERIRSFMQVEDIDYHDTFALVPRLPPCIAAIRHWELHELEINNAFLHGDFHEEVH
ncbi:NAC domain-containing protein 35-like [Diospyros lotus]|uniref:NAC domain-containing protein 35-like n=1 Tax=Diospyros lotus TaxID=55363 RepID=UPI00224E0011|nr:NAC domain-containing protein 35-like [Diospyros lotus]